MGILAYSCAGYAGELVTVEVDIRRGIPGVDVVGLPDGAVREAKERIRAAIRNSGYEFPASRLLVNLAPASLRKEGGAFDLPIALAILIASGQAYDPGAGDVLALGELELSGRIRPVPGVLAAVSRAAESGCLRYLVPAPNSAEARSLCLGEVDSPETLTEAATALHSRLEPPGEGAGRSPRNAACLSDQGKAEEERRRAELISLNWPPRLLRALAAAAAGGHHLLLAGPPGGGKSLACRLLPSLLPDLDRAASIEVSRIHSLAGLLAPGEGLIARPPFRSPHHSASLEGMVGGGRIPRPGEISLAHRGVLFLDEAPEFGRDILQALREPIEEGRLTISRAVGQVRFPADFQLLMAANPCPCGNLGRRGSSCLCSLAEVERYWRRLGGALLDRIDLRLAVLPGSEGAMIPGSSCLEGVERARRAQAGRFAGTGIRSNARIPLGALGSLCSLGESQRAFLREEAGRRGLSLRSVDAILRLSRTLSDLDGCGSIGDGQLAEALSLHALGEGDPASAFEPGGEWGQK